MILGLYANLTPDRGTVHASALIPGGRQHILGLHDRARSLAVGCLVAEVGSKSKPTPPKTNRKSKGAETASIALRVPGRDFCRYRLQLSLLRLGGELPRREGRQSD